MFQTKLLKYKKNIHMYVYWIKIPSNTWFIYIYWEEIYKKPHFALIMIKSQNTNLETCAIFAYG